MSMTITYLRLSLYVSLFAAPPVALPGHPAAHVYPTTTVPAAWPVPSRTIQAYVTAVACVKTEEKETEHAPAVTTSPARTVNWGNALVDMAMSF